MSKQPGGIVVIDGADGTGKATTTKIVLRLLQERAAQDKLVWFTESFPNYSSYYGQQIRNYLDGDEASVQVRVPKEIRDDPYCASLAYAADRYVTFQRMKRAIAKGGWYLLDRYISSNMAHQGAKIAKPRERADFYVRLQMLEHSYFNLPEARLTVVLNLPESIRRARVEERRAAYSTDRLGRIGQTDIHEQDDGYMAAVAKEYGRLARDLNDWRPVECAVDNIQLPQEEIAQLVLAQILEYLKLA